MDRINTTERLTELRKLMKQRNIDIYVVPSEDAHASEYIAPCDERRAFISGFSGSAGCAVVSLDKAALATDGRYYNQAARQLDDNWTLLKQGMQDVPTWQEWSADESSGGKTVGLDPSLVPASVADHLAQVVRKNGGKDVVAVEENLVDIVWGAKRPAIPREKVTLLSVRYSGKTTKTKLSELRAELEKRKAAGYVMSQLDDIAWLFNLRGSDIPFNPVFFSYAIVNAHQAILYVDDAKLDRNCKSYLEENSVDIKPYGAILEDTKALALAAASQTNGDAQHSGPSKKFLISNKTSWMLKLALGGDGNVEEVRSPVGDAKAVKNKTELEGMRQCHIKDGVALIKYFAWLEDQLIRQKTVLDEVTAADKLEKLRSKQRDFMGLSFPTISATGADAAVIHYQPERGNCATIDPNAIYLCDSGAQYMDGTTDTTRTLHFGKPTEFEITANTLVLKGNIALDRAIFPRGTTGFALDSYARQYLWKEGLDYRHGTGHGVGSFLNVHEGPIGIGTRKQHADVALAPGNVTSIEPGFYEDGAFGIRIENVAIVKEVKTKHSFGDKPFLGFEHVTMVPYCRALIDAKMLTEDEKSWLNDYSKDIWEKTSEAVKDDPLALEWLKRETQPFA